MEPFRESLRREISDLLAMLQEPGPRLGEALGRIDRLGHVVGGSLGRDIRELVRRVELFRVQGGADRRREVQEMGLRITQETGAL